MVNVCKRKVIFTKRDVSKGNFETIQKSNNSLLKGKIKEYL